VRATTRESRVQKAEATMTDGTGLGAGTTKHAVVIAGGGPTGMMLAAELALANVDVAIVERRETQDVDGSRAGGFHARTVEVLAQRGIADRFLSQGQVDPVTTFAMFPLDISDFPGRHNVRLALRQEGIERILAERVAELPVCVLRGRAVTDFAQDDDGVDVTLSDGSALRAGRMRRRSQPGPQEGGYRVPGLGGVDQLADR
jgi:2-polyprenyl-6-methoxyphenol hydroxylase-like FAD-dependent oxidoreductase